ncbi:hypothetical protein E3N88_38402 [Mikania micrantha]|uniref:Beta-galactosidase n=1 Tax=Mikania micrantha TaxID=192012 RepID=A0A5N6LUQ7_9ASTR|nr:hypothetical protein E3N88_38402 [Mikania micrantha]
MDSWSEIQLRKMDSGGNENLNKFLSKYGISKEMDIVSKYYTNVASGYGEKIQALAEALGAGTPWVMCRQTDAPENIVPSCLLDYNTFT